MATGATPRRRLLDGAEVVVVVEFDDDAPAACVLADLLDRFRRNVMFGAGVVAMWLGVVVV